MIKLTSKRQLIFDILKDSQTPLSSEDIFSKLNDTSMNLSTVYRTLDYFYQNDLVSRNYLDNKTYYYLNEEAHEHHHFMVCEKCGKKYEMDCQIDKMVAEIKQKYGFEVTHHDLNFYGLCEKCAV